LVLSPSSSAVALVTRYSAVAGRHFQAEVVYGETAARGELVVGTGASRNCGEGAAGDGDSRSADATPTSARRPNTAAASAAAADRLAAARRTARRARRPR